MSSLLLQTALTLVESEGMTERYDYNDVLVAWLRDQYGPGKKFRSARSLSLAAGRSNNFVSSIEESGHSTAEGLLALSKVLEIQPVPLFRIAGWLPAEVGAKVCAENPVEEKLLGDFRLLPEHGRHMTLGAVQGMLLSQEGQE